MFSQELENLIQASLEDGILEDYEKAALVKRAQNEGVDLAELEIYINSLLQKRARELENEKKAERKQYEKEKKEAFGRTCPNCGKQVPPLTLKCECGYEFTKGKTVSSVQMFFEKINNIQLTEAEIDSCSKVIEEKVGVDSYKAVRDVNGNVAKKVDEAKVRILKEKKKREIITTFPVPNTKEDIIEFLSLSASKSKKRGGIFGTTKGRLIVVIPIALIIFSIICNVCITNYDKDGWVVGLFLGAMAAGGFLLICLESGTDILEDNKTAEVWQKQAYKCKVLSHGMRI